MGNTNHDKHVVEVQWRPEPTDEEIMENMLKVRYEHAKSLKKDYSHLFRTKSRLELIRLSVYQIGVEFCYAAETAFVSPILLGNGLQYTFMTMVWAFAPTLGFLCAPLVASFSDQLRSGWGRRRPVLLMLGLAVIVGLLILPHGKQVGIFLGDDDVPVDQMNGFRWGVLITVIGLILTDFDIETSSGVGRTYFMDVCIAADHARVLTTAMIIGGVGGAAGYTLGAIDWQQTDVGSLLGSNEATVFAGVVIVLGIALLITLTSFREVPLPLMEQDPLLKPVTPKMFEAEKNRQLTLYSITGTVVTPKKPEHVPVSLEDGEEEKPLKFLDFFKNLRRMPRSLAVLYLTQFLAQAGYMSYCLYFTDFVGSTVFGGDVTALEGTPELQLYDQGVRFGCWGMALFAISTAIYSLVIERVIKCFSARFVLVGGLLAFSVGMLLMGIINTKWMVLVCGVTVGIMYATIYSVPFLLISQYHARNSFAMKDGKLVENEQRRGFGADVSMLSSMLFLAQNGAVNGFSSHIAINTTSNNNNNPDDPPPTVREKWGKNIEFLLSCVALSVGFGNVWRFPYTAFNNGGGAFVIPYLIVLFIIGRPIYYLEMVLGQFSNRGCVKVYDMAPLMRGIGVGQTVAIFTVITYYAAVLAITFRYLVVSFSAELPWSTCDPSWVDCVNSSFIGTIPMGNGTKIQSSAELYFQKTVLHKAESLDNGIGMPDWRLVLCLVVAWICITAILIRGIKSSGKFSYFLAIFPYIIIFILLARSLTLPGAWNGILYFFKPQWDKLLTIEVWYEAVTQCFFSLTICFGGLIVYSSFNNFQNNIYRHAVIITWLDTFTSMIAGCIVFGVIGHLAHVTNQDDIRKVVKSGPGLTFETYPDAIAKFDFVPQLFSVLFFFMLFLLGIGTLLGIVTSVITAIHDQNPHWKRWKVVVVVAGSGFCIGLVYLTPGGLYILDLMDYYGATFVTLTLAVFELLTFAWIYGVDRVCKDIEFMLGIKTGMFWRICWGIVTPIVVLVILLFSIIHYVPKELPSGYNAFGWCLYTVAVLQLPAWGLYAWYKHPGSDPISRLRAVLNPMSDWGPEDATTRAKYHSFIGEHEATLSMKETCTGSYVRRKLFG